jgi:hypothetical protein
MSPKQVLADFPDFRPGNIRAAPAFAAAESGESIIRPQCEAALHENLSPTLVRRLARIVYWTGPPLSQARHRLPE